MKFRVERDALADAVTWAARSLSARPTIPVLAGLLLTVTDDQLSVSGFDLEASTEVDLEVAAAAAGQALVSGRLLADITRALPPHPVDVMVDGSRLTISCGSARFTLPTMPVEDYPRLPTMPTTAGTVDSAEFATAVAQVAIAAGRDDTLPMLTGVRLEIEGDHLTLAATDRYRLAVRELTWNPGDPSAEPAQVLVPARTLADAAKSLSNSESMTIALSSAGGTAEGIIGFSGSTHGRASRTTTRLLDATFPAYRSLLPTEWASTAEVVVAPLVEAVKRVALVADRNAPVRLEFADGSVALSAGGEDEGRAEEQLEVGYEGDPITTAFNPQFLLDGLGALSSGSARLLFTSSNKPVVLRPDASGAGSGDYTYLIMPVRLPG
ncbi:MAG: polymerase subunit beta [Pseudonocardiales bacterium]|jgi:DNA polymerase-3 subunit beta|nr:dnaN [Pseudonocardiales bacterium]MDT4958136.1 polymerase subunit beta [Pseudonocardiales bacterium]MDT4971273.1 polymerase subunit beta [Pseudonocardiales bacterium]MDT4975337.1 polymerase subunit beta [Pseudonocardiales bacterium]MDT4982041.1 polymerase subunit beta [Pseudonocardiales bacterium]